MQPSLRQHLGQPIGTFLILALVMAATRFNHFSALPDASWAVFLLAGFHLRGSLRWAFPALMALAVAVDYLVISASGISFWSHYCVSPGYWFLLPAHFALWAAGDWLRRGYEGLAWVQLPRLAVAVLAGVAVCHLFAQGGFYWFSDSVANPTAAGWLKNYADWFLPYLATTSLYVGIAAALQVALALVPGLRRATR